MNRLSSRTLLRSFLIMVLLLGVVTSSLYADDSKLSASFFEGVRKEVLPNGLTIITQTNNGPPLVSINFFVNTGSINEDDKNTGISHFCEHMFYRGTSERSNVQLKTEIESYGGMFNAETSKDFTRFYVNVPSEYGLQVLKIYADALMNANYLQEHVDQERKVVLEEYSLTKDNPMALLSTNIYRMAFPDHPYGRATIGTEQSIKRMSRDDLMNYKTKWYSPEHIVVVLVGNFNREKYVQAVKDIFRDLPGGTAGINTTYAAAPLTGINEKAEPVDYLRENTYFVLGFRSPAIKDINDVLAMDLITFLLGEGKDSLLERELVKKQKLTQNVGATYLTSKDSGLVMFHARVQPKNLKALREGILAILDRVKKGDFTDEELYRGRNMLIRSYLYTLETNDNKAQNLGFYEFLGGVKFAENYVNQIQNVSREELMRVANKYFSDNYVVFTLEPEKE